MTSEGSIHLNWNSLSWWKMWFCVCCFTSHPLHGANATMYSCNLDFFFYYTLIVFTPDYRSDCSTSSWKKSSLVGKSWLPSTSNSCRKSEKRWDRRRNRSNCLSVNIHYFSPNSPVKPNKIRVQQITSKGAEYVFIFTDWTILYFTQLLSLSLLITFSYNRLVVWFLKCKRMVKNVLQCFPKPRDVLKSGLSPALLHT